MKIEQRTTVARQIVTSYLRGDIDPVRNPEMFDEDIVYFAVARLDRHDLDWILSRVANPRWPCEIRADIVALMLVHQTEGLAAFEAGSN